MGLDNQDTEQNKPIFYQFQLFVGGESPVSLRAIQNGKNIFEKKLKGRYNLELIDIIRQPERAVKEDIITIPTLIKITPLPVIRVTGDLSDTQKLLNEMLIE